LSSILNALKKIEESAPPEESLNPAWFQPAHGFGNGTAGAAHLKTHLRGIGAGNVLLPILIRADVGRRDPRGGKPVTAAADSAPAGGDAFRAKLPDGKKAAPSPPVAAPPPSGQAESAAAPAPIPGAAHAASAAQRPAPPAQAAKPAARALPKETPRAPSAERPSALARELPPPGKFLPPTDHRPSGPRRTTSAACRTPN
jgi:hypothetical protein